MGLDLDTRQRAMLAEMKVPVWWPESAPPEPTVGTSNATKNEAEKQESAWTKAPNDADRAAAVRPVAAPARPALPVAAAVPAFAAAPTLARTLRPDGVDRMDWPALQTAVAACRACGLCERRRNTVFGVGDPAADWMFVGEAPGENEDLQGEPFVGQAGHLLDNMLKAVGLSRSAGATPAGQSGLRSAYIANVVKCRPPGNRNPEPGEIAQCEPFLARQVALVQPKILVAMGRFAANTLLAETVPGVATQPLGKLRGQVHSYRGIPVVATFHPAYLLRSPAEKAKSWADLCLAMDVFEGVDRAG